MPATDTDRQALDSVKDDYKYGWSQPENYVFKARKGLDHEIIDQISVMKREPEWMRKLRHDALDIFFAKPIPTWGADLSAINYQDIYYYIKPVESQGKSWDDVPADIKETFDKLGIPEAERKFLAGAGAQYECLSGDMRVATGRGLIPIRDIEVGDTVFAFDETQNRLIPAPVKAKMAKGEREVFEVRVHTKTIRATANHPFLILAYHRTEGEQRGRFTREWKYLADLKPGDLVAVAKQLPDTGQSRRLDQPEIKTIVVGRNQTGVKYDLDITNNYNPISLPTSTSADLMWWLGLYLGDGFIHYQKDADKARVEFAIPETDTALRSEFKRVTQSLFGIAATNGDPNRMTVYSTILARFLEVNGLAGRALTKQVPQWVHTLPEEERLAFLGGYVDADGYVRDHRSNHDVVLTSGSDQLLAQVQALATACGISTSSIHHFQSKHPLDKQRMIDGYRMELSGDFERLGCRSPQRTERIGKRRYSHNFSSTKRQTFHKHTNQFIGFARIESITPVGVEPVYDIEVDGPHNFVAEGLIVHNSEAIYHSLKAEWEKQGVIFVDSDSGLREHPEIYQEYFGTVVPSTDNVFAALNTAAWSGGSFVYVPKGVHLDIPLQAYFRINAQSMGQFERTLIIVDEGASVHYVEGCTAPTYSQDSLHSGVIEIIVRKNARCRYTTIQNWSTNVYNLVTQRSLVYEGGTMEWVDSNLGSKVTMKYPSVYMLGAGAHGQILSMAFAGRGQHLDTGGKLVHAAPNTSSQLISKSISKNGGRASYRGLLKVGKGAHGAKSNVVCDALLLDEKSRSDTYPYIEIDEDDVTVGHEASVSKIGEEQLFYLQSRGLSEDEASAMIVSGFIEPMVKELPMEYAVEMNRLIQLQMEGSIG